MENKDLMIYNAVANVAARVFASFDAVMFQPGKYDVPAVLNRIKSAKAFQDEDAETAANEIVKIEIDTFTCSFRAVDSFELLKRLAAAYQIPTACRAQFTKKADSAPVAVSFRVFAGLKDLCSRISKDTLHPCFNYICVDTKRRALIVCDQYTLSAVPVPEMFVSEDAKEKYLITPAVLKAGHGVCNIDTNGTATNGAAVSAVDEEINYPNIARVLFTVPSEFITLGKNVFSELKKNVSAAAKFGKIYNTPVILKADAGANEIEIIGYRENKTETNAPSETRRAVVSLPQPVPFAFAVAVAADRLGKVLAAEKMYLKDSNAPVCFVDETRRVFSVMYPGKDLNKTPFFNSAFEIPVPAGALSVDAVAGTFAPVQDAPAVPFEDEETSPALPAVSEDTKITFISKNYVPAITDEIKNAVAVAAEYKYIPYYENKYGVRCSREHTVNIRLAELLLQRENLFIENYALICGNGQTFAYISKHDEEIVINYDVAQDEETPAADSVPAANDIETLINNKFAAYLNGAPADSVPAVSEETAPAVAVSLPVPVSAVYPLHAVYIDNVLHGVYFSKLLADEIFWNAFFAGRAVYDLEILSNETAPETERAAVLFSADSVPAVSEDAPAVAVDEETNAVPFAVSEDEETPAVANSRRRFHVWPWLIRAAAVIIAFILFAVNDAEKTPAVAVSVQDAQETPAAVSADSLAAVLFAVPEDAPAVQDKETPAVAVSVAADSETPAVADKQPQTAKKQPQTRRKRARRAESCKQFAPDAPAVLFAVADSLAADSLANVPAVADSLAADSLANVPAVSEDAQETAPAVQDEETDAPAVVSVPEDEETPAVADSVPAVSEDAPAAPADSVPAANSPAPAVPAVSGCPAPAVPAAVTPYVIGCVIIH